MIALRVAVVLAMIAGLVWSGGCEKTSPSTSEENRVSAKRPARASGAEPDATAGEGPAKATPGPTASEPLATPKEEPTPAADTPLPVAPTGEGQLAADDEGTVVSKISTGKTARHIKNKLIDYWEKSGVSYLPMPLQGFLVWDLYASIAEAGKKEWVAPMAGQGVGLVKEIKSAEEVLQDIIRDAGEVLDRL